MFQLDDEVVAAQVAVLSSISIGGPRSGDVGGTTQDAFGNKGRTNKNDKNTGLSDMLGALEGDRQK